MSQADLEKDLVAQLMKTAEAMNVFLAVVGQRRAKGSGTTLGFPDLVAIASGKVALIEVKNPADGKCAEDYLNLGQIAFIEKCAEKNVKVHVVGCERDFVDVVNSMRRREWGR